MNLRRIPDEEQAVQTREEAVKTYIYYGYYYVLRAHRPELSDPG